MVKEKKRPGKKNKGNRHPSPITRLESSKSLIGNEFWKIRSKHGRDRLFASPELMWEAACEYFQWCIDNPYYESKPMSVSMGMNSGSEIEMVEIPVKRPYTLQGLCLYLDCASSYFRTFKYSSKDKDFLTVIEKIEDTIYNQQFSGAASGFLNANIISRALGLIDKQDVTTAGEKLEAPKFNVYNSAPPLAGDEQSVEKEKKKK